MSEEGSKTGDEGDVTLTEGRVNEDIKEIQDAGVAC